MSLNFITNACLTQSMKNSEKNNVQMTGINSNYWSLKNLIYWLIDFIFVKLTIDLKVQTILFHHTLITFLREKYYAYKNINTLKKNLCSNCKGLILLIHQMVVWFIDLHLNLLQCCYSGKTISLTQLPIELGHISDKYYKQINKVIESFLYVNTRHEENIVLVQFLKNATLQFNKL